MSYVEQGVLYDEANDGRPNSPAWRHRAEAYFDRIVVGCKACTKANLTTAHAYCKAHRRSADRLYYLVAPKREPLADAIRRSR